ncbi:hypothetical protein PLESTF_001323800 [Pleodorina starrii]|nr:hypothetical protein PLESTF_001323800 [Pleodorina starrii]
MFRLEPGNLSSAKFLEELVGLERATFKKNDSWADGELEQMAKKRNCIIVVARLAVDGKAVLRTAANQRRSSSSTLHVALDNEAAVQLYRSLGYKEDGLLEDYYTPGRHAYKMICDLEPYKGAAEEGSLAGRKR